MLMKFVFIHFAAVEALVSVQFLVDLTQPVKVVIPASLKIGKNVLHELPPYTPGGYMVNIYKNTDIVKFITKILE